MLRRAEELNTGVKYFTIHALSQTGWNCVQTSFIWLNCSAIWQEEFCLLWKETSWLLTHTHLLPFLLSCPPSLSGRNRFGPHHEKTHRERNSCKPEHCLWKFLLAAIKQAGPTRRALQFTVWTIFNFNRYFTKISGWNVWMAGIPSAENSRTLPTSHVQGGVVLRNLPGNLTPITLQQATLPCLPSLSYLSLFYITETLNIEKS